MKLDFNFLLNGMDVVFYKKIKINANDAFEYFNINQNVCKSKKTIDCFGKLIVFEAENPDIKRLKEIKILKKNKLMQYFCR